MQVSQNEAAITQLPVDWVRGRLSGQSGLDGERRPACFQSRCPRETTTVDLSKPTMGVSMVDQDQVLEVQSHPCLRRHPHLLSFSAILWGRLLTFFQFVVIINLCLALFVHYDARREIRLGYDGRKGTAAYREPLTLGGRGFTTWTSTASATRRTRRDARGPISLRQEQVLAGENRSFREFLLLPWSWHFPENRLTCVAVNTHTTMVTDS